MKEDTNESKDSAILPDTIEENKEVKRSQGNEPDQSDKSFEDEDEAMDSLRSGNARI